MNEHLTKPTKYDIEDSNIALLGSDVCSSFSTSVDLLNEFATCSSKSASESTVEIRKQHGMKLEPPQAYKFGVLKSFMWFPGS